MLKQPATYDGQIAKLREHGCAVTDEDFCKEVLSRIGYYRLSAYFLPFKSADGGYKSGTEFGKVYKLYEFDRKLRRALFSVLEETEVYLRTRLAYFHAHKYGADGYMNPANFNTYHNHDKFMTHIDDLLRKNRKVPFVKHHAANYGNRFPIWVLSELLTFGMLSHFYADLPRNDQKAVARELYATVPKNVISWLYCCTDLRNFCAHYNRLYYRVFTAIPANIPQVDKFSERKLFASVMALGQLYPDADKWNNEFLPGMSALLAEYKNVILLRHIGYPKNWETVMRKQPGSGETDKPTVVLYLPPPPPTLRKEPAD